jgi:ribosomal protein S18 acetylase RimI-like enzyme
MKINELQLDEITRLSKSGFEGGKDYLDNAYSREKNVRKLPGGSGLFYSITNDIGYFEIKLWDKVNKGEYQPTPEPKRMSWHSAREHRERVEWWQARNARQKDRYDSAPGKLVGKLSLSDLGKNFPLNGAVQVSTITVDENYQGIGLAKALYGIVLTIMKRPLLAGSSQTPGGRRNWMSLSQIPGVEMKGYFSLYDDDLDANPYSNGTIYAKRADQTIDVIMGQLGGQHIGDTYNKRHYFAFDVQPNTTKQELKAYVDTKLSKVYGGYDSDTGLYAVWTGKQ